MRPRAYLGSADRFLTSHVAIELSHASSHEYAAEIPVLAQAIVCQIMYEQMCVTRLVSKGAFPAVRVARVGSWVI